jgi:hypothetical protein
MSRGAALPQRHPVKRVESGSAPSGSRELNPLQENNLAPTREAPRRPAHVPLQPRPDAGRGCLDSLPVPRKAPYSDAANGLKFRSPWANDVCRRACLRRS